MNENSRLPSINANIGFTIIQLCNYIIIPIPIKSRESCIFVSINNFKILSTFKIVLL